MTGREYVFSFKALGLEQIEARLTSLRQRIDELTQGGKNPNVSLFGQGFEERITTIGRQIRGLIGSLEQLRVLQEARGGGFQPGPISAGSKDLPLGVRQGENIAQAIARQANDLAEKRLELTELTAAAEQRVAEAGERDVRILEEQNHVQTRRIELVRTLRSLQGGGDRRSELIEVRRNALLERQADLQRQLAEQRTRLIRATPENVGREALEIEDRLINQITASEARRLAAVKQLAAARQVARDQGLEEQELATIEAEGLPSGADAFSDQQLATFELIFAARQKITAEAIKQKDLDGLRVRNLERIRTLEARGGARVGSAAILERIGEINRALTSLDVGPAEELNRILGFDLAASLDGLIARFTDFEGRDIVDPDEVAKLNALNREAEELVNTIEGIATKGIPLRVTDDELFAGLSKLERTALGAFRGLGRRFQATLQFALSGAIIFAAQRFVREFISAAIEVERTFADIATSLEFDIEAPRGSAEFERVLDGVRDRVLQIADDFNVLPTQVNEAAFVMISRFRDIDAALTATRAQILATRVATIDQQEALRALTAVAEVYGLTFAKIADETERQRLQADLYTKVLDKATVIQQKFGIQVEDSLEGAAGLAENFRLLGFSVDQTLAIVAAAVRRTGQTGQAVSDRLARSIGQITTPQIKDELLTIAKTFDQFELSERDFASGEKALTRILEQAKDIPQEITARIAQTLGQRRETAFVSAVLSSAETIDDILNSLKTSAGAAENRVGVLLQTTQGAIEGIKSAFFELAQNLQSIGLLKPLSIFLQAVQFILGVINKIVSQVNKLINLLNFVRLPSFLGGGLGTALKALVAMVVAAKALQSVLRAIAFAQGAEGFGRIGDFFKNFFKGGGANAAAQLPNLFSSLAKVFPKIRSAIISFTTAMAFGATATVASTTAETGLTLARFRLALATDFLITRSLVLAGIIGTAARAVLIAIAPIAGALIGLIIGLGVLVSFIQVLAAIPAAIGAEGTREERATAREQRAQEIVAEEAESGAPIGLREGRIRAAQERIEELERDLQGHARGFFGFIETGFDIFALQFGGFAPGITPADFPGTLENITRQLVDELEVSVGSSLSLAEQELISLSKDVENTGGRGAAELEEAFVVFDALKRRFVELATLEVPAEGELNGFRALARALEALGAEIPLLGDAVADIAGLVFGFESGSFEDVAREMAKIAAELQLGLIGPAEARRRLLAARAATLGIRREAENEPSLAEDVIRADEQLLQIAIQDLQTFEQESQRRRDTAVLIRDQQERLAFEIEQAKIDLSILQGAGGFRPGGPETIRKKQLEIAKLEIDLVDAQNAETRARIQLVADTTPSIRARIKALDDLKRAIFSEVVQTEGFAAFLDGTGFNLEQERALIEIAQQQADDRQALAIFKARNNVLQHRSSLDSLAAIQATIAQLQVELAFLRQSGADVEEVLAKQLALEAEITKLRVAESERRAAFFLLTAGVGDEIKVAQAGLRAARDRLDTILGQGGRDTKAAFEAQLDVLRAERRLAELAADLADAQRRLASDITDPLQQAFLDIQAARDQLALATGDLEKAKAQRALAEAEASATQAFFDDRLNDLDFLFRSDQIGRAAYISGLRELQAGIDRTKHDGEQLWREIELQIKDLLDATEDAFNIPTDIVLPTLFEVRRALAADALSVDYQDNRDQTINVIVTDNVDIEAVISAIDSHFGSEIDLEAARLGSGGTQITIGSFG